MKFTKYCSIENSYREKYINQIIEQGYGNEEYVVLSKLDGANFSFICDGNEVKVASRTQVVDGQFFNCQSVIDKYSESVSKLFNYVFGKLIKFTNQKLISIQLYGELIGDGINNRVKYCSGREFVIFDLLINTEHDSYYCNYDSLVSLTSNFSLFNLTSEHFRGNLRDCLDYCTNNLTFNSLIPKLLNNNYANLEVNYEEGYVIRPVKYLTCKTGNRVILKCKSPEFAEVKYKQSKKDRFEVLTEEEQLILDNLSKYITESRVYSVTSKLGLLTTNGSEASEQSKHFGKVLGAYVKDLIEDFSKDNELPKLNKKLNNHLNKKCADCIRGIWLNLL